MDPYGVIWIDNMQNYVFMIFYWFHGRSLVVYNPTEQDRSSVATVYVDTPHVRVVSETGQPIPSQISAVWETPTQASEEAFQVRMYGNTLLWDTQSTL